MLLCLSLAARRSSSWSRLAVLLLVGYLLVGGLAMPGPVGPWSATESTATPTETVSARPAAAATDPTLPPAPMLSALAQLRAAGGGLPLLLLALGGGAAWWPSAALRALLCPGPGAPGRRGRAILHAYLN